jgi:hypothetical protein
VVTVAIMQPTYLPWLGYFDLMDQVDVFVYLDDVQFSRQSWQQRNRIRAPQGLEWLTVPVVTSSRRGQSIREVEIVDPPAFVARQRGKIEARYRPAPHFGAFAPRLFETLDEAAAEGRLAALNVRLIEMLAEQSRIAMPRLLSSSQVEAPPGKVDRLVAICRALGAERYLSPLGSAGYLADAEDDFRRAGIELAFHGYAHPTYPQMHAPFLPYASVVDLLFNDLPRASEWIRQGRGDHLNPAAAARRARSAASPPGTGDP